jgi:hypothetical protein
MKTITRGTWVAAALILACLTAEVSAFAQAAAKPPSQGAGSASPAGSGREIRRVDFRNFTFPIPREAVAIQLRNGKQETQDENYSISRIIYGDLNADGHEEAAVCIGVENKAAANPQNAYYEYDYVYAMRSGKVTLLAIVDQSQIYGDVRRFLHDPDQNCNDELGSPVIRGIAHGLLLVGATGGGRFCSKPDKYDVTLRYRWDGTRFVLVGEPLIALARS